MHDLTRPAYRVRVLQVAKDRLLDRSICNEAAAIFAQSSDNDSSLGVVLAVNNCIGLDHSIAKRLLGDRYRRNGIDFSLCGGAIRTEPWLSGWDR